MSILSTGANLSLINSNIQAAFGLNTWQLRNGMYNGCTFMAVTLLNSDINVPILQNNPAFGGIVNATSTFNQFFGTNIPGADPNRTGQLYDTTLGMMQCTDKIITGTVQKQTPYTDSINIEDTGFKGYEFRMSLIFVGADYMTALSNFENAVANPPTDPAKYLVLQHPTRGLIKGLTYVIGDLEVVHSMQNWRGCLVNVTFRSVDFNRQSKPPLLNTAQKIARAISAILNLIASISGGIATLNAFTNNLKNQGTLPLLNNTEPSNQVIIKQVTNSGAGITENVQFQQIYLANNVLQTVSTTLMNVLAYVYKTGEPGVSNSTLDSFDIDYSFIPTSLNQSPRYTLNQGGIIMNYYDSLCITSRAALDALNLGSDTNDILIDINSSVSAMGIFCEAVGNATTYNTYVTAYPMSIRRVLNINNISLSNMAAVMALNPQLQSANYIPADTLVNLL